MIRVYPITLQEGASSTGSFILMLLDPQSQRQVPIIIGAHEAHAILMAREGTHARRPLTHELMLSIMRTYGLSIEQVSIDRVNEGIFYATIHVSDGFNQRQIDARTTDAVALALQAGAPIFMAESVLNEASVRTDTGSSNAPNAPASLQQLLEELKQCEENEDYERAAEIQKQIDNLSSK